MAQNTLTTVNAPTGAQTATQTPQASVGSGGFGGSQSSTVQPGTSTDLLNNKNGVTLKPNVLPTANLNVPIASTAQPQAAVTAARHTNPALFGISALLLLAAVVLFYTASRSAKNTTE